MRQLSKKYICVCRVSQTVYALLCFILNLLSYSEYCYFTFVCLRFKLLAQIWWYFIALLNFYVVNKRILTLGVRWHRNCKHLRSTSYTLVLHTHTLGPQPSAVELFSAHIEASTCSSTIYQDTKHLFHTSQGDCYAAALIGRILDHSVWSSACPSS